MAGHIVSRVKSNHSIKGLNRLYFTEIINKDKHERLKDLDENEDGTIFFEGGGGGGVWLLSVFEYYAWNKRLLCAVFSKMLLI